LPLLLACCWAMCFDAHAIVDANSGSNTKAPSDGSPWGNVGAIVGASGVYIGGGWVLTVWHVGVGSINLSGTSFSPDGTFLRLTNSDGSPTDLILFHLVSAPPWPSLPLASVTPAAFSQIDMIGFGYIAGSAQTNFGVLTGFDWSAAPVKSWGNNKVNFGGTTAIDIGNGKLTTFTTDFTSPGTLGPTSQTSDEAQVATGDSGGGVFQLKGSVWQLAGVLDAEQNQVNQPDSTAAYGDKSYMADIATYRSEIVAVLNATPVPNLSLTRSGSNSLVCWLDTGVNYNLEATGSLDNPNWVPISQSQFSTNGQICVTVPDTSSFQFFRLQKP
jgi:hypothetical protein